MIHYSMYQGRFAAAKRLNNLFITSTLHTVKS